MKLRRRRLGHRGGSGVLAAAPKPVPGSVEGHPHRARPRRRWLRYWQWCEAAWSDFLFLVLPSECLACGAEDQVLCHDCARELREQTRAPFRAEKEAPALVDVDGTVLLPVVAAGEYRDALATTILAFKNHGRTELARPLARALLRSLEAALGPRGRGAASIAGAAPIPDAPVLLVPIPGSGAGRRRRGYEPVTLLLAQLRRMGSIPAGTAVTPCLRLKYRPP